MAELVDRSAELRAAVESARAAWLYEVAEEVASQARAGCSGDLKEDTGQELNASYRTLVRQQEALVGSSMEQALWEEYGTGEHAVRSPHRSGWWVYVAGQPNQHRAKVLTEQKAKQYAAAMRAEGLDAYATNGRDPHYTLERAFNAVAPKARKALSQRFGELMGA